MGDRPVAMVGVVQKPILLFFFNVCACVSLYILIYQPLLSLTHKVPEWLTQACIYQMFELIPPHSGITGMLNKVNELDSSL